MQISGINAHLVMLVQKTALRNLFLRMLRRLHATRPSTIAIYLLGLAILQIWALPFSLFLTSTYGWTGWPVGILMPLVCSAAAMLFLQQVSVKNEADMVCRPVWFMLMVALAVPLSYAMIWIFDWLGGFGLYEWFRQSPFYPPFFRYILFFAPISWLSCLYARRTEDEAQFAMLSVKRSQLHRELAQSQLLAARSQVDLSLVTRTLRKAYVLYDTDLGEGFQKTDQLIAYLRLAMSRSKSSECALAAEMLLLRAYISLKNADSGPKIELQENSLEHIFEGQAGGSAPVFLAAQKMHEAASLSEIASLALRVEALSDSVSISCCTGKREMPAAEINNILATLKNIAPKIKEVLHHESEDGDHWYVIEFPSDNDSPGR